MQHTFKTPLLAAAAFLLVSVAFFSHTLAVYAGPFLTATGGTGTSSPSGLLYGDAGATNHLNTVTIGTNLTFSGGTLSASGGGGSGTVGTSTGETSGQIAFWTSTNGTPALLGKVATSSETCSSPLSCTGFNVVGSGGGAISLSQANATTNGYVSSADYNTFFNKVGTSSSETTSQLADLFVRTPEEIPLLL